MAKTAAINLGVALCDAIGLDANNVGELTFRIGPGHIVTVEAQIFLTTDQALEIEREIQTYRFEAVKEVTDGEV